MLSLSHVHSGSRLHESKPDSLSLATLVLVHLGMTKTLMNLMKTSALAPAWMWRHRPIMWRPCIDKLELAVHGTQRFRSKQRDVYHALYIHDVLDTSLTHHRPLA